MLAEVYRRTRRFALSTDNRQTMMICIGIGVGIFVLAALYCAQSGAATPWAIGLFKLPLIVAVIPLALHGSIAGERDRRSWDALCVAPVTDGQIVAGKFAAGLVLLLAVHLVVWPVQLAAFVTEDSVRNRWADFVMWVRLDVYTLAFGFFVTAVTFLASVRSRRPFPALGAAVGVLIGMFAISIASMTGESSVLAKRAVQPLIVAVNPILHVAQIVDDGNSSWVQDASLHMKLAPEFGAVFYLAIGIGLLVFAARTLHAADQEVVPAPKTSTPHA